MAAPFPRTVYLTSSMRQAMDSVRMHDKSYDIQCIENIVPDLTDHGQYQDLVPHVAWYSNPTDLCISCFLVKVGADADPSLPNKIQYACAGHLSTLNEV